jgi:hypothetical protein
VPGDNTLPTIKSTNAKTKIASGYNVYSASTDGILICTYEVQLVFTTECELVYENLESNILSNKIILFIGL